MSDYFLAWQSKEALRLRSRGHTYNYIAEKLNMTPEGAKNIIQEEMEKTKVMDINEGGQQVTEITIRLTHPKGDPRIPFRLRQLMELVYVCEAEWEREFRDDESANGPILLEPATFSVSRVLVDSAPQTGKNVIFPDME